jgi:hypothetical protein
MILKSNRESTNAKRKLRLLEVGYAEAEADRVCDEHVRELELESLQRLINQLKKEVARYEARYIVS